jgi:polyisoprenoid-binding protein YceI
MSQTTIPAGVLTGTYQLDPSHTSVGFNVRHMMFAKVQGAFSLKEGTVVVAEDPVQSSVTASIDALSIDTRDPNRDAHLRSADFLDAETYPTLDFRSRTVRPAGDNWVVEGDLTIHGVTRPATLEVEVTGAGTDPWGNTRAGFEARTTLNRSDFGLTWNQALEAGGVLVGDKITIDIAAEAVYQAS